MATYTYNTTPAEDATLAARLADINTEQANNLQPPMTLADMFTSWVFALISSHTVAMQATTADTFAAAIAGSTAADQVAIAKILNIPVPTA